MNHLRGRYARFASERGASAVEWVIITAIISGVALGLAMLIKTVVEQKQGEIVSNLSIHRRREGPTPATPHVRAWPAAVTPESDQRPPGHTDALHPSHVVPPFASTRP